MDVATIAMSPEKAKAKLKAYRKQLHRRVDEEYQAAADGYAELAKGRALINLSEAIRQAPRDHKHRPMLAVARADRKQVMVQWESDWTQSIAFNCSRDMQSTQYPMLRRVIDVGEAYPGKSAWRDRGYALVPMVPADVREQAGNPQLKRCFVLWEVERWADRRHGSRPDRDPYLLSHLGGDLYSVLAAWDLTDLERAVMAGRAEE